MASTPTPRHGAHFSGKPAGEGLPPRSRNAPGAKGSPSHAVGRRLPTGPAPVRESPRRGAGGIPSQHVSGRTAQITRRTAPRTAAQRAELASGAGSNRAPFVVGAVVLAALVVLAAVFVLPRLMGSSDDSSAVAAGQDVTVTVPEGSGGTAIAQLLKSAGVISDTEEFSKEVQKQGASQSMKSGTYSLVTGMSAAEVVQQLVAGPNSSSEKLTLAEGLTMEKTAAAVESSLGIPAADFLAQAKASNYVADYPFLSSAANDSLEGFLYPKTYNFSGQDVTADLVIRTLLDQYQAEVASLDFSGAEESIKATYGIDVDDYDILTLASIIEKEAVTDSDRPLVSSVFYNRLRQGMALQSDATMGYVTGGAVTSDDLKEQSPYNTYLNTGLPPTPICTPSLESIEAAMAPADTSYLYFLIIENGSYSNHTFSETYEEHLAAIAAAKEAQS